MKMKTKKRKFQWKVPVYGFCLHMSPQVLILAIHVVDLEALLLMNGFHPNRVAQNTELYFVRVIGKHK